MALQKTAGSEKKTIAYLTDCNFISDESIEFNHKTLLIIEVLIKEHSTHFNFLQALEASSKIGGKHIWFTLITHKESHLQIIDYINEHINDFPALKNAETVFPSYDKLIINT